MNVKRKHVCSIWGTPLYARSAAWSWRRLALYCVSVLLCGWLLWLGPSPLIQSLLQFMGGVIIISVVLHTLELRRSDRNPGWAKWIDILLLSAILLILAWIVLLYFLELSFEDVKNVFLNRYIGIFSFLIFIGFIYLIVWQRHNNKRFTLEHRDWIGLLPILFLLPIAGYVMLSYSGVKNDESIFLGYLFGFATLVGLSLSLTVLDIVSVDKHEIQLMEDTLRVINSAEKNLYIFSFTPFIGYFAAIRQGRRKLIRAYERRLLDKLTMLKDSHANIKVAFLCQTSIEAFIKEKTQDLRDSQVLQMGFVPHDDDDSWAGTFRRDSTTLNTKVGNFLKQNSDGVHYKTLKYQWGSEDNHLPPLSLIIADNTAAVVFYNFAFLNPESQYKGEYTNDRHQVSSLIDFFNKWYYEEYTGSASSHILDEEVDDTHE